jgi:alpha-mannosidase
MYHRTRWTLEKITQRLELIGPLVYRKQKALPSFRYIELNSPLVLPPTAMDVDDSGWQEISANQLNLKPYQIVTIRLQEKA